MTVATPVSRPIRLPRWRELWFRLHGWLGLAAGSVLVLIGLSGAVLAFRDELIDGLNPGGRQVAPSTAPVLSPPALLQAVRRDHGGRAVGTLALFRRPGAAARVIFEPAAGERRGETVYLDPYSGRALPPLVGGEFFESTEALHRWLLLPREPGRVATGVLAASPLLTAVTGLSLRRPRRRALQWRSRLTIDPKLKGRPYLRALHAVLGSCCLAMYLVSTSTGLYWAFDAVRDGVDALVGEARPAARAQPAGTPRPRAAARTDAAAADIAPAWAGFERQAGAAGWSEVIVRVPAGAAATVLFTWLDAHPAHERARNRMIVRQADGSVVQDDRYEAKSAGQRFVASIYPLHLGTYFGLPGRLLMLAAALMLPVFAVTGWLLYLKRRRQTRIS